MCVSIDDCWLYNTDGYWLQFPFSNGFFCFSVIHSQTPSVDYILDKSTEPLQPVTDKCLVHHVSPFSLSVILLGKHNGCIHYTYTSPVQLTRSISLQEGGRRKEPDKTRYIVYFCSSLLSALMDLMWVQLGNIWLKALLHNFFLQMNSENSSRGTIWISYGLSTIVWSKSSCLPREH